ncbi:MAG: hypothetical protein JNL98_22650 [Bryobacterales bacterium]|nr:hypothetical protein [Bryobacterales bacterium]
MKSQDTLDSNTINLAYDLAFLLTKNRESAIRVVDWALTRVDLQMTQQDKRRRDASAHRNKVLVNELSVMQRLVLYRSQYFEELTETATDCTATEDDMVSRWIAFLARISYDNSLYSVVARTRILHTYSIQQSHDIYGVVMQDPGRDRDDDHYRRLKCRFHSKLKKRFGGLVETVSLARKEERFKPAARQDDFVGLAKATLRMLTPWGYTAVEIPQNYQTHRGLIPELAFHGGHPDDEAEVECRRVTTVLQPKTFWQLTRSLHLAAPCITLSVPEFSMPKKTKAVAAGSGDEGPQALPPHDRQSLLNRMRTRAIARVGPFQSLSILVDGEERWTSQPSSMPSFHLTADDEFLELCGKAGQSAVPLGVIYLVRDESHRIRGGEYAIELQDGVQVALLLPALEEGPVYVRFSPGKQPDANTSSVWSWLGLQSAPQFGYAFRLGNEVPSERRSSRANSCPSCGGVLMFQRSDKHGTRNIRVYKCDRCPLVGVREET